MINIAPNGEPRFGPFIQLPTVKLRKYHYGATAGQLNGFIIDLIYYAFSGAQSGVEALSENRYRLANV